MPKNVAESPVRTGGARVTEAAVSPKSALLRRDERKSCCIRHRYPWLVFGVSAKRSVGASRLLGPSPTPAVHPIRCHTHTRFRQTPRALRVRSFVFAARIKIRRRKMKALWSLFSEQFLLLHRPLYVHKDTFVRGLSVRCTAAIGARRSRRSQALDAVLAWFRLPSGCASDDRKENRLSPTSTLRRRTRLTGEAWEKNSLVWQLQMSVCIPVDTIGRSLCVGGRRRQRRKRSRISGFVAPGNSGTFRGVARRYTAGAGACQAASSFVTRTVLYRRYPTNCCLPLSAHSSRSLSGPDESWLCERFPSTGNTAEMKLCPVIGGDIRFFSN